MRSHPVDAVDVWPKAGADPKAGDPNPPPPNPPAVPALLDPNPNPVELVVAEAAAVRMKNIASSYVPFSSFFHLWSDDPN